LTGGHPRWPRLLRLACANHRGAATPGERVAPKAVWSPSRHCADCRVVWADGEGPDAAPDEHPPRRSEGPPI